MKYGWSVLFCILFLFGCGPSGKQDIQISRISPEESDLKREMDFAYGAMPVNNPLAVNSMPAYDSNILEHVQHSFTDYLFSMINPEALRKYEGSYTVDEFREQQSGQTPQYSLSSSWVIHNPKFPKTGVRVVRSPETGKYEVSGGEIFLPGPGVGVSYEKNEESGETRTLFNMKREF